MISIQRRLQQAHRGYAYEMLELQMAVQDQKSGCQPSITEITRLIQLYMVLSIIINYRQAYKCYKVSLIPDLYSFIIKFMLSCQKNISFKNYMKHLASKSLPDPHYQPSIKLNSKIKRKSTKQIYILIKARQISKNIKQKKRVGRQNKHGFKKTVSEAIGKDKIAKDAFLSGKRSQQEVPSPVGKKQINRVDPRMEYFNLTDTKFIDLLPKNKALRTNSGSLQKNILDRKYLKKMTMGGSGQKDDPNDAI